MKFLTVFLIFFSTHADEKIVIGHDNIVNKSVNVSILIQKYIAKSYKNIGKKVQYKSMSSDEILKKVKNNEIDADFLRYKTVISQYQLPYVPVPTFKDQRCIFSRESKMKLPLNKAHIIKVSAQKAFEKIKARKITQRRNMLQAVKEFNKNKEIDYLITSKLGIRILSKSLKLPHLNCVKVISEEGIFHIIAPKNVHLIPKLEKEFKKFFPLDMKL